MLLRATELAAAYEDRPIFEHLNFELKAGVCLHVIGDNGTGKSTLLKIASGLKKRSAGEIERAKGVKLAYLGHELGLMPDLSVKQNIAWYHGLSKNTAEIKAVQERFQLNPLWETKVSELSRGQMQRVALARVMLARADVWILDEALTGLDQDYQRKFFDSLESHLDSGGAAILATHLTHLPVPHTTLRINHVHSPY